MMNKLAPDLLRLFLLPQKMLRRPPTDLEKNFWDISQYYGLSLTLGRNTL